MKLCKALMRCATIYVIYGRALMYLREICSIEQQQIDSNLQATVNNERTLREREYRIRSKLELDIPLTPNFDR